jgi:N-acetylglucosamine-6-phosphate deacetylase
MRTLVQAARLLTPQECIQNPAVLVEDGRILSLHSLDAAPAPQAEQHLHYGDATLVPSFLDVHIHGACGHDAMESTREAVDAIGVFLARHGVGAYLATTVTASEDKILFALDGLATQVERAEHPGARPVGIHLEGPFLSCEKRGVHPPELLRAPSVERFERYWQAARGQIALITVAPELPGAVEMIAHATRKGVRISIGHSNAHASEALAGIAAGAVSATHTFNAMRALDHRDPGIVGVVLNCNDLFAEMICDKIHVAPEVVRLFWKAKGPERSILVTDAMSATGMPDGNYQLGPLSVSVSKGTCLSDGKLAGSVLTLDRALQNFMECTGCDLQAALRCMTANPAAMIGREKQIGCLEIGGAADITVLTPDGSVQATLLRGKAIVS